MKNKTIVFFMILFAINIFANEKAIIHSLSYIGIDAKELSIDYEYVIKDSLYLNLINYVLQNPYENEFIAINIEKFINNYKNLNLYEYFLTSKLQKKRGIFERIFGKKKDFYKILNTELNNKNFKNTDFSFFIDTLIEDSVFYNRCYIFNKEIFKKEELIFLMDKILQMDKEKLKEFAKFLKNNYECLIYDSTNNTIMDTMRIIIDYGGDDTYYLNNRNTIIIDFGGNDTYIAKSDYALACADNGISFIIDINGNDNYYGKNFSNACAFNGCAFINDRSGDDIYKADFVSIGAGICGYSAIYDNNGDDLYLSKGYSQGFGSFRGVGIICDNNGNDNYIVSGGFSDMREADYHAHLSQGFGFGIRDFASGGAGIIIDNNGSDNYKGEYFVQGSSYWLSYGLIYDKNGNDNYNARRYSQGAGVHFSTGVLFDLEGNDNYLSWGVSQGCGHDYAVGMLCDYKGDDNFISEWLSQGAGNANGEGFLFDFQGNNTFTNIRTSFGYADYNRSMYSIGILYLLDSNSLINGKGVKTNINGKWGIIINE